MPKPRVSAWGSSATRSTRESHAVLQHVLHRLDKPIQLIERRVHARRHAHALDAVVRDGRDDEFALLPKMIGELGGVDPLDLHAGDRARPARIGAVVEAHAVAAAQAFFPVVAELAETRFLALGADAVVEEE